MKELKATIQLELFISSACPYSWPAEKTLLTLAMMSDKINLNIIDAMEFQQVAEQYNVYGIPITIINGKDYIFGTLQKEEFI